MYTAQPSCPPLANPNNIAVISPQFCAAYPVDLAIVRKVWTISDGNFVVADVYGNLMFKVKGSVLSLRDTRVLFDNTGNPILTLREKIVSKHSRWQVFRGKSSDPRDLIFSAKRSSIIQLKTKLDVFLVHNTSEVVCDFKVKGSWSERSCVIYAGESSNIVAQMHKKTTAQSVLLGTDQFNVTVYPHVDHAFVIALILILEAINNSGA